MTANDLARVIRARNAAHSLELETEDLFTRTSLIDPHEIEFSDAAALCAAVSHALERVLTKERERTTRPTPTDPT